MTEELHVMIKPHLNLVNHVITEQQHKKQTSFFTKKIVYPGHDISVTQQIRSQEKENIWRITFYALLHYMGEYYHYFYYSLLIMRLLRHYKFIQLFFCQDWVRMWKIYVH